MPKNKEALIRYRVINRMLVNRKRLTKKELMEACEQALDKAPIGERTIDGDIHAMRYDRGLGYDAPINYDRASGTYSYQDPSYSIDKIPLNEEELDSAIFASRLLEQFREVDIFRTFTGSVQKLMDAVNIYKRDQGETYRNLIEFEKAEEVKGTQYLEPIIDALKNKTVLSIEYQTFHSRESKNHIIHPYLLKEYRNRWYLVGYHHHYKNVRTYGLDRILELMEKPGIEFTDTGFDAHEYYRHVIGVSVIDKKPEDIHVAFTPFQAQYVLTQPLHHSQELISESDEQVIFKFHVVPNFEFFSHIMGWGDAVEILKPESIRKQFGEMIGKVGAKYRNR